MKRLMGLGLLTSAFAPLVAVLAILRFPELGLAGWGLLALCASAILLLVLVLRRLARIQERPVETKTVKRGDERVLAFTSSYLVPIVVAAFGQASAPTLAATVAVVMLMAMIYVRASLFHLNPTLALMGYRLYEVTAVNGTVTMLLTRHPRLPQEGIVNCRYLGEDVAIQLRGDKWAPRKHGKP
jgi:MFS family permease